MPKFVLYYMHLVMKDIFYPDWLSIKLIFDGKSIHMVVRFIHAPAVAPLRHCMQLTCNSVFPTGTLAAHWQVVAMTSRGKPIRSRELIQGSLKAAIDKARDELQPFGPGVVCVTGSLYAVADALKLTAAR